MSILSVMDWVTANVNSSLSPRVNGTIQNGAVGVLNSAGFTSSNLVVFDYSAKVVDVAQSAAIFVECMENQSEQKTMGGADGYLFTNYLIDLIIVQAVLVISYYFYTLLNVHFYPTLSLWVRMSILFLVFSFYFLLFPIS